MDLFDKITTIEDFKKVRETRDYFYETREADGKGCQYWQTPTHILVPRSLGANWAITGGQALNRYVPASAWWFIRESMRYTRKMDEYGDVLSYMWNEGYYSMWCPKPHAADLTKIEFYPDAAAAIAERPIVTTLAKFLRRMSPLLTDEYIRDVDAQHRACMSNEVEILTGLDAFREAYITGPHSCMSYPWYDTEQFPHYEGRHPVDAYSDIPGIGMAVTRIGGVSTGKINGRCIVYINPDNPNDKRAIRVYGDTTLTSRLKRAGFKFSTLAGLTLKLQKINTKFYRDFGVTDPTATQLILAPYLDGPEGRHNDTEAVRNLLLVEGEDRVRLVTNAQASNIIAAARAMGNKTARSGQGNSSGYAAVGAVPASCITHTCPITGKVTDLLVETMGPMANFWINGAFVPAEVNNLLMDRFPQSIRVYDEENGFVAGYFSAEDAPPTFMAYDGSTYAESPELRARLGYMRMDPVKYPEYADIWVNPRSDRYIPGTEFRYIAIENLCYKKIDCMEVLVKDPNYGGITQGYRVKTPNMEGFTRVHSVTRGVELWADASVKTVKTRTGRLVIPGYHAVVELYDGTYAFERTTRCENVYGQPVHFMREESRPVLPMDGPIMQSAVRGAIENAGRENMLFSRREGRTNWENRLWYYARRHANSIYFPTNGMAREHGYFSAHDVRMTDDLATIRSILAGESEQHKARVRTFIAFYREVRKAYIARFLEWQNERREAGYPLDRVTWPLVDTSITDSPDVLPEVPADENPDAALAFPETELTISRLANMSTEEFAAITATAQGQATVNVVIAEAVEQAQALAPAAMPVPEDL